MLSGRVKYSLDEGGRFSIENYNWAKPISNFLPGIAGKWGIPMWVYYVSKHQGVCSLGIQDKDHAIMEFQSLTKPVSLLALLVSELLSNFKSMVSTKLSERLKIARSRSA